MNPPPQLAQYGLNLFAVLDWTKLSPDCQKTNQELDLHFTPKRLILVGNGGPTFWEAFSTHRQNEAHPVDQFCIRVIKDWLQKEPAIPNVAWLYPLTDLVFPLQQAGKTAGWHLPSPLGIGIHKQYGLWFAYRAALLTDAALPLTESSLLTSPCEDCIEKPCIQACPVQAITATEPPHLERCSPYRLQKQTHCQNQCLSRMSCPYASEYRYTDEQIRYHYQHSYQMLLKWYSSTPSNHL